MKPYNIAAILRTPPHWQQGEVSFWILDTFNGGNSWIGRYTGTSPWEMHPQGEEFFYILEGAAEFTLLTENATEKLKVAAGETFVIPRKTWHRQVCEGLVISLGATTGPTQNSMADDPRREDHG